MDLQAVTQHLQGHPSKLLPSLNLRNKTPENTRLWGVCQRALTSWFAQAHIWTSPLVRDIGGDSCDGGQGDGVWLQSASLPHGFSVQVFCLQNSGFICIKETKECLLLFPLGE